jgi:beta-galactosidase
MPNANQTMPIANPTGSLQSIPLKNLARLLLAVAVVLVTGPLRQVLAEQIATGSIDVRDGQFLKNGHPYQILSGELHYARIPRAYWRDRLKKAKAMGLNTISVYVFWNSHEPRPGVYDFTGNLDVAEFIRIAQQEGLDVLLRPGPYVCAEWELGGYPAWLLKNPAMVLRSNTPAFMEAVKAWMTRLGKELASLQSGQGGPIIGVQLENEYGSFGSDKVYLSHLRDILLQSGFTDALMYTVDGIDQLHNGTLPGVLALGNFGPGNVKENFAKLSAFEPGKPLMSGEYWVGWYDKWGVKHAVVDQNKVLEEYEWMLTQGYSVNIYMFHGGTTFGFMNGATVDKGVYHPAVNSYNYNSPLDESGRPTKLYYALRDIIARHNSGNNAGRSILPVVVPDSPATISIPQFPLAESASLWEALPAPTFTSQPKSMEALGQAYGYILYRTTITKPIHGDLVFGQIQDYAQVYVNGTLAGTIDRRLHQDRVTVDIANNDTRLDVLVENTGRVNYGDGIRFEWKGIRGSVMLGGHTITNWKMYSLPMDHIKSVSFIDSREPIVTSTSGPTFYRGYFSLDTPGDTFLDMRTMTKGVVWVNGHLLSRFWEIGPQQTLYLPGPWLHSGTNSVVVFDLFPQPGSTLRGLNLPLLDGEVPIPQQ